MYEFIDSFGDTKVFTTLVAYNGYRQVSIAHHDRHITSFSWHACTYQYILMHLWLNKRTSHLLACDRYGAHEIQVKDLSFLYGRCHHLLELSQEAHHPR